MSLSANSSLCVNCSKFQLIDFLLIILFHLHALVILN